MEQARLNKKLSALLILVLVAAVGCNAHSSRNRYQLAEKLLEDKKYEASIAAFQEIVDKEPNTELGKESIRKIAEIQLLYLGKQKEAEASYKELLEREKDEGKKFEIEKKLAEIAFTVFEDHALAIERYRKLLEKDVKGKEADFFTFQIGKSYFHLGKFSDAIAIFEEVKRRYPSSPYVIEAEFEIANSYATAGKCKDALKYYEKVVQQNHKELGPRAVFGQASCYEELDDLDTAYDLFSRIRDSYPAPQVVDLKMVKIKRRKILRKR